jgi:hypothetical protein
MSLTQPALTQRYADTLDEIRAAGLFKSERIITSPQSAEIALADGRKVLNFCANNYLGLADHPDIIAAAKEALDSHGFGMASVRFICGTQDLHKQLEGPSRLLRHRGHHPLRRLLRRQRRPVRAAAGRARRDHQRRAQPCLDHRWRAPVQGAALPLCQRRHGRPGSPVQAGRPSGVRTRMITSDGVFSHGRLRSPRWTRSDRAGEASTARWCISTNAMRPASSAPLAAAPPSSMA